MTTDPNQFTRQFYIDLIGSCILIAVTILIVLFA